MLEQIKQNFKLRPSWMNAVMLFCLYMTFIYLPWDVFIKPLAIDQEVWFGIVFYGWLAKLGGILHWLIYGAGAYGLWQMKSWVHPWIVIYIFQIAYSMGIWGFLSGDGGAAWIGPAIGSIFLILAWGFYQKRDLFINN